MNEWLFMILIKYSFFYNDVTTKSLKVGIDEFYHDNLKSIEETKFHNNYTSFFQGIST